MSDNQGEKFKDILTDLGISVTEAAERIGISRDTIHKWFKKEHLDRKQIVRICKGLGIGESDLSVRPDFDRMVDKYKTIASRRYDLLSAYESRISDSMVFSLDDLKIPIYDIKASAGIQQLYMSNHGNPIDYLYIPGLGKVDGAIPAFGDSMLPLVKSGDYVVYKFPTNLDNGINWGKMYVVGIKLDGEDLVTLKYIHKSKKGEEYVCLVSENKEHSDVDVHLNDLQGYAIVKAYVSKTILI